MNATKAGRALIQTFESCRLTAYPDSANVWTIGWGTTRYPDGRRVAKGDTCTQEQADAWFWHDLRRFEDDVDALTTDRVTPRQFDALVSFTYNVGQGHYRSSTLRKKVNANPNDPAIRAEFTKWVYSGGKKVKGLLRRRIAEADHYFGEEPARG